MPSAIWFWMDEIRMRYETVSIHTYSHFALNHINFELRIIFVRLTDRISFLAN